MGIFAARIDGVLIVRNVLRRETLQILTRKEFALLRPVGIHELHRVRIEMHIMTHFIEGDIQRVLSVRTVQRGI